MTRAASRVDKARRALSGARLLLEAGDTEGACSRAYYAMFDAAHAALDAVRADASTAKTHAGLISAFGSRLVQPGILDAALGRSLNRVERLRLIADYLGDPPSDEQAASAVAEAAAFVDAVAALVG